MANEVKQIEQNDTALYLITKAEVDNQIATAKAFPRVLSTFLDEALTMATINEEIAQACTYSLPRGGKIIDGPSVRLAEIISSAYGNMRSGARVIDNDGKTLTIQGICHDLEKNVCVTIEVKRKITDKNGNTFNEDMQVVAGNAGSAIAFRNAVFKVVPNAYTQMIHDKVKEVARGKAETLSDRRDKAVAWFAEKKVTEKQICEILEVKKISDIDLDKLSILSGFRSAIKSGESTVKEIFSPESLKKEIKIEIEKPEFTESHFEQAFDAGATIEVIRNGYTISSEIEQQYNDYVKAKSE